MSFPPNPNSRRGFTLVELLVVIAIIGILVALLLPAVQAARESARRTQCRSNLKNVALSVLNYEASHGTLPAALSSDEPVDNLGVNFTYQSTWLLDVFPFLEEQTLADSFDHDQLIAGGEISFEGAANRANIQARGTQVGVLQCPSDGANAIPFQSRRLGDNWGRGNYAANAGPGNWRNWPPHDTQVAPYLMGTDGKLSPAWHGHDNNPFWPAAARGVIGPKSELKVARITDGTSKTMLLAEVRAGINEFDWRGVWAIPHPGASVVARHGSGGDANGPNPCNPEADDHADTYTEFDCGADGSTHVNDCMACNNDVVFGQAAPRSTHAGGVFIALVDGSVNFVTDDIEITGPEEPCCSPWDHLIMSADGGFMFTE